jgi:HSP20 family protein
VERLALDLQRGDAVQALGFAPRLEVLEGENEFVVTAELPGLEEKDFQIEVHGSVLTVRGEKRSETAGEQKGRHFSERVYGEFRRAVELPVEVSSDKASASFKNGVLTVTLPKAETAKVRHIPVDVA